MSLKSIKNINFNHTITYVLYTLKIKQTFFLDLISPILEFKGKLIPKLKLNKNFLFNLKKWAF